MTTYHPPTLDELRTWAADMGADTGLRLADESDAFISVLADLPATADALRAYGQAYIGAAVRAYCAELRRRMQHYTDLHTPPERNMP